MIKFDNDPFDSLKEVNRIAEPFRTFMDSMKNVGFQAGGFFSQDTLTHFQSVGFPANVGLDFAYKNWDRLSLYPEWLDSMKIGIQNITNGIMSLNLLSLPFKEFNVPSFENIKFSDTFLDSLNYWNNNICTFDNNLQTFSNNTDDDDEPPHIDCSNKGSIDIDLDKMAEVIDPHSLLSIEKQRVSTGKYRISFSDAINLVGFLLTLLGLLISISQSISGNSTNQTIIDNQIDILETQKKLLDCENEFLYRNNQLLENQKAIFEVLQDISAQFSELELSEETTSSSEKDTDNDLSQNEDCIRAGQ